MLSVLELLFTAAFNPVSECFKESKDVSLDLSIKFVSISLSSVCNAVLFSLFTLCPIPGKEDSETGLLSVSGSESDGKSYRENLASRSFGKLLNSVFDDRDLILDFEKDFLISFPILFSAFNFSFNDDPKISFSNLVCISASLPSVLILWLFSSGSCLSCCG